MLITSEGGRIRAIKQARKTLKAHKTLNWKEIWLYTNWGVRSGPTEVPVPSKKHENGTENIKLTKDIGKHLKNL